MLCETVQFEEQVLCGVSPASASSASVSRTLRRASRLLTKSACIGSQSPLYCWTLSEVMQLTIATGMCKLTAMLSPQEKLSSTWTVAPLHVIGVRIAPSELKLPWPRCLSCAPALSQLWPHARLRGHVPARPAALHGACILHLVVLCSHSVVSYTMAFLSHPMSIRWAVV